MAFSDSTSATIKAVRRVRIWYALLLLVIGVFGVRLFDVQIIHYDHYKKAALSDQLKQYKIPASRGIIEAQDGGTVVPIVLNQKLYTLYADPVYIKNPKKVANVITKIIGGNADNYASAMKVKDTRYVILAKKITQAQTNKIVAHKIPGLGTQEQDYRTYPQGALASQLLGFVDDSGQGQYGVEQALNGELAGQAGRMKAITDTNGVPLAASNNNVLIQPKAGKNVVLTIDMAMQQQLQSIVEKGAKNAKAPSVSALIMDPNTGQIKAMANYPSYNPSEYYKVSDPSVFKNGVVDHPIEVGSSMKTLTTAAALNQGVIQPNTTFYDPAHWVVDGFNITDIEEDGGPGEQSIASLLNLSLNTGATWELMQMGGGKINQKARDVWHDYMVNHFLFGKATGVEQGYEAAGYIPSPENNGAGINLTYANTSFGQAMTATPLQMGAALSSVLNGGTYYRPTLVSQTIDPATGKAVVNKPEVVEKHVVSPKVGQELIPLMEYVVKQHYLSGFSYLNFSSDYIVGGKTGTAQVAKPSGGYYDNIFNGTYVGFVGGDKAQYVIVVFVNRPQIAGYAGSYAAQPIFSDAAHMLIDNSYVTPKRH